MLTQADDIIRFTIKKFEGGFVNHPNDRGGPTKYGITITTYKKFLKRTPTLQDMKNMPIEHAIEIYKKEYWKDIGKLAPELRHITFDMAVHHGYATSVRMLQRVLGVKDDGKIGPITAGRSKSLAPGSVIAMLVERRIALFDRLIKKDPEQKVFEKGWKKRARYFLGIKPLINPTKLPKPSSKPVDLKFEVEDNGIITKIRRYFND